MAKRIFLDIETLPPTESDLHKIALKSGLQQSANTSVENEAEVDQLAEGNIREMALHGEFGRVLTIGIILEEDGELIHHGLLGRNTESLTFHLDEKRTLRAFWKLMQGFNLNRDVIVGHNVLDFDLPFIVKRSIIHQIKPSLQIPFRRYQRQPIFDTMWEWSCWRHRVSLNDLALALGMSSPKGRGIDGSLVFDAWLSGREQEIALYCMRDVECVREVFYRLNFESAPPIVSYETKVQADLKQHSVKQRNHADMPECVSLTG
ncbi:MAG: ribonuclease H-like domain-containing protein [Acidobacteria bacterium]|nr:ribonuclease H-like domain-containing protein [Acidobacteriota bacterium]